jgi:hypothetical protein
MILLLGLRIQNSICEKTRNSAELYGVPRNKTLENSVEVNSLPQKILYSAEFQKGTSVNTLVRVATLHGYPKQKIFFLSSVVPVIF